MTLYEPTFDNNMLIQHLIDDLYLTVGGTALMIELVLELVWYVQFMFLRSIDYLVETTTPRPAQSAPCVVL